MTVEPVARRQLATAGELAAIANVRELRPIAAAIVEPAAWDYIDGGAWDEVSLAENEAAWLRHRLRPRVLVDVRVVDPATTMLGAAVSMPLAIAPMAAHGLANAEAELAVARAAAAAGIAFIPSTMSSRSLEEIAAAAPGATRWFQLYVQADPGRTRSLVERAAAAGYGGLVVTVDLPELGYRDRDRRTGFALDVPLGNFPSDAPAADVPGFELVEEWLAKNLTWDSLAMIRSWSRLPIVLKGILTAEDARLAIEHGVDAIVVSNHGGRQLDGAPSTISVLPEVAEAVAGRCELLFDGGVQCGQDVLKALACGARACLIGKTFLYALAAGGEAGVRCALELLRRELEVSMALTGVTDVQRVDRTILRSKNR